jgi:hypothetical protein
MPSQSENRKKTYLCPKLKKLTLEQPNLILTGHASFGDQGAKDLLEMLYPPPVPEGNHYVRAHFGEPAPIAPLFGLYAGGTILAAGLVGLGLTMVIK